MVCMKISLRSTVRGFHQYNVSVSVHYKIFYKHDLCNDTFNRALFLKLLVREEEQNNHNPEPLHQSELQRCKFLMNQALDADEAGLKDIAVKLYTDAAELGLSTVSTIPVTYYVLF